MSRRKKKNNWGLVGVIALIIIIVGVIVYFVHASYKEDQVLENNNSSVSNSDNDENVKEDDITLEEEQKKEQESEDTEEYNFNTQTGEEVKVDANKMVEATGFSGASNYKFYLRGTTLYFLDTSVSDNVEEILAYNVKDLYLENKEVKAELYSDGEIVRENNYITYK